MGKVLRKAVFAGTAGFALGLSAMSAAAAGACPSVVYVAPTGLAGSSGTSCAKAAFSNIQTAVEAAPTGGTVIVCRGTYAQSVTVDKRVHLEARGAVTIDASGQPYGIGVATSWVTVRGFTVENANSTAAGSPDDGIITAGFVGGVPTSANHVTVAHNVTENNAGAGIDLNSTSYSTAIDNRSIDNGIGINMSNDLGPASSHNRVIANVASKNPGGCGIVLADHTGVGIFDNVIAGNHADDNGLGSSTAPQGTSGSGIILAGAAGGVYGNTVSANEFSGNGHAGVAVHAHVPGANYSGNVVTFNRIGVNNVLGDFADASTTGVYVGDASPVTITVSGNVISRDHNGIFTAGSITVRGESRNVFVDVAVPVAGTPVYSG